MSSRSSLSMSKVARAARICSFAAGVRGAASITSAVRAVLDRPVESEVLGMARRSKASLSWMLWRGGRIGRF